MKKLVLASALCLPIVASNALAIDLIGKTTAKSPVNVVSEISGVISQANWQTGDVVYQGASLATLKNQDFQLAVSKQQANVALVTADLDIKHSIYQRYQELRQKNSLSQHELDVAKANYSAAKASLTLAKIELETAQLDLANTQIQSDIDGYVVSRNVEGGAWVNQGDLLYQIVNIDQLNIRLLASEFDLKDLSIGQPIQVWSEAAPNQKLTATINRIGVELDPTSYAYPVEIEINNAEHTLKPGMSIHATTEFDSSATPVRVSLISNAN